MLDKLLKRYMPWMDKGRWYKISFNGASPDTLVFNFDRVFESVNYVGFSAGNITIGADFAVNENNLQVIDVKFVGEPGHYSVGTTVTVTAARSTTKDLEIVRPGYYSVGTTVTAAPSTTKDLEIVCPGPGTIWLFITSTRGE